MYRYIYIYQLLHVRSVSFLYFFTIPQAPVTTKEPLLHVAAELLQVVG